MAFLITEVTDDGPHGAIRGISKAWSTRRVVAREGSMVLVVALVVALMNADLVDTNRVQRLWRLVQTVSGILRVEMTICHVVVILFAESTRRVPVMDYCWAKRGRVVAAIS